MPETTDDPWAELHLWGGDFDERQEAELDRKNQTTNPVGRELRLLNEAIGFVYLLENGLGITLTDSAKWRLRELRQACEQYVGAEMRLVPVRIITDAE